MSCDILMYGYLGGDDLPHLRWLVKYHRVESLIDYLLEIYASIQHIVCGDNCPFRCKLPFSHNADKL